MSRLDLFRKILKQFLVDAPGKTSEDDKYGLYDSSTTDSGVCVYSGELTDSGLIEDNTTPSSDYKDFSDSIEKEAPPEFTDSGAIEDMHTEPSLLIDSGVCLSENFSKISLKGLNNLNAPKKTTQSPPVDSFWKNYYVQDEDGDTTLHVTINTGLVEATLALIRAAPHPRLLDTPNDDAETPLHLAVASGQWRVARWLIVAGARPCPRDLRGDSPLHIAARADDYMCVKAIADPVKQQERDELDLSYQGQAYKQCDFDQWNYLGQTCVHVAAIHGNVQVMRHLIWYGANVNAREGCMGYTALHYAVQHRDEALVRFLLQCEKIDVGAVTYGGRNALEVTLIVPAVVRQLLRSKGVPSPCVSDEDSMEESEESDDEPMYEKNHMLSLHMVNASA